MFQKSFVEFFVPFSEVKVLEERLGRSSAKRISMYAANKQVRVELRPGSQVLIVLGRFQDKYRGRRCQRCNVGRVPWSRDRPIYHH